MSRTKTTRVAKAVRISNTTKNLLKLQTMVEGLLAESQAIDVLSAASKKIGRADEATIRQETLADRVICAQDMVKTAAHDVKYAAKELRNCAKHYVKVMH